MTLAGVKKESQEDVMKHLGIFRGVLVIVLIFSLMGCSNEKSTPDTKTTDVINDVESSEGEATSTDNSVTTEKNLYGYNEPIEIKVAISLASDFTYVDTEDAENNAWMDLYRSMNIVPEILYETDSSQAEAKLTASILSGDYPDVFSVKGTDLVNYAADGTISDITEVFEEYASDELKEYVYADGGLSLQSAMVDGRLYGLPFMGNGYDAVMVMFVRQDWLDALGLEMPQTMEELKEVAYAFTYDDPDGNGKADTYGVALNGVDVFSYVSGLQAIFEGFGAAPGNSPNLAFIKGEDDTVIWGGSNAAAMKDALQLMQDMYNEGSIAKEFITMDGNSIFEESGAGRCGIWFGPMWAGMSANANAIKSEPDAHITASRVPDGGGSDSSRAYFTSSPGSYYVVSSDCVNTEVLIKLMNLSVEKLCASSSDEEFLMYYGDNLTTSGWKTSLTPTLPPFKNYDNFKKESTALLSGDTSNLNTEQLNDYENMKAYLDAKGTDGFDPEDATIQAGVGLYTVFGDPKGGYAAVDEIITNQLITPSAYNAVPTTLMSDKASILNKLATETILKIVLGEPVDQYDTFLENWMKLGGEEVLKEAQEWFDANN